MHAGTDAALFAELESAYQRQAPVMLWIYAPHWAPAKYKGEWIEFPNIRGGLLHRPGLGRQPDATHDCGKPRGPIWKVGWAGIKDKWPGAYKAIKAFKLDNDEMGAMIAPGRPRGQEESRTWSPMDGQEREPLEAVDRVAAAERSGRPAVRRVAARSPAVSLAPSATR